MTAGKFRRARDPSFAPHFCVLSFKHFLFDYSFFRKCDYAANSLFSCLHNIPAPFYYFNSRFQLLQRAKNRDFNLQISECKMFTFQVIFTFAPNKNKLVRKCATIITNRKETLAGVLAAFVNVVKCFNKPKRVAIGARGSPDITIFTWCTFISPPRPYWWVQCVQTIRFSLTRVSVIESSWFRAGNRIKRFVNH